MPVVTILPLNAEVESALAAQFLDVTNRIGEVLSQQLNFPKADISVHLYKAMPNVLGKYSRPLLVFTDFTSGEQATVSERDVCTVIQLALAALGFECVRFGSIISIIPLVAEAVALNSRPNR